MLTRMTGGRKQHVTGVWSGGAVTAEQVTLCCTRVLPVQPDLKGNVLLCLLEDANIRV